MALLATLAFSLACATLTAYAQENTYKNPIIEGESSDPSIYRHNGYYYLTISRGGSRELTIYKSADLTNFRDANSSIAYRVEENTRDVWASEMHHVHGDLYLYFAMSKDGVNHKIYAIKADDPMDPMGKWGSPVRVMPFWPDNLDQVDGTVFEHLNGRRYMMWVSGVGARPNTNDMTLWIAEMFDALRVGSTSVQIRYPMAKWETEGRGALLGPSVFHRNNITYLVFSASDTFNPESCLGMMHIRADKDPMQVRDWNFGPNKPVFWKDEDAKVWGPGHPSFTVSPDGTETWMVYHASSDKDNVGPNRIARAEKIEWDHHGFPKFPRPSGTNTTRPRPSANGPWWHGQGMRHDQVRGADTVDTKDGLSGGAIAGIVIGVLAGVALLGGVGYWMKGRRNGGAAPSFGNNNYSSQTVTKTHVTSSLDTHA